LGKYRWRSSWRDDGEADFSRAENEDGSGVPAVTWFADAPWQGALSARAEPAEATPRSTSRHNDETKIKRRAYAILLIEAGRCWLLGVEFVPEAIFSCVTTGRRASEEGELPPLRKSMVEESLKRQSREG
jgi:hypothetical protein